MRRAPGSQQLWSLTVDERVAAMWGRQLTLAQLQEWTARAPHEVPLIGDELAWIAMLTPEWLDTNDS